MHKKCSKNTVAPVANKSADVKVLPGTVALLATSSTVATSTISRDNNNCNLTCPSNWRTIQGRLSLLASTRIAGRGYNIFFPSRQNQTDIVPPRLKTAGSVFVRVNILTKICHVAGRSSTKEHFEIGGVESST
jgi:precorrin-3B methylase